MSSDSDPRADRLSSVALGRALDPHSLVGSYFHTYDDDERLHNQGCVVAEPAPGVYLVELFSFLHGGSTQQELRRLDDMTRWRFYDTAEWMNNEYEEYSRHRDARERAEEAKRRREAEQNSGAAS